MRKITIFQLCVITILVALIGSLSINSVYGKTVESPRKQLEDGVAPKDIICKPGKVLVILDGEPACLNPSTVSKLEKRGHSVVILVQEKNDSESKSGGASIKGSTGSTQGQIENIPASAGSIVNFYVSDDDLNTSPNGVDIIPTSGLLEFTINGISIPGPETMIETGPNTGKFYVKLELPETVNGKPITQNDIVEIRYLDQSSSSGDKSISTKSLPLSKTYANVSTSGGGQTRIGHHFTLRIYEPDANLDSRDVDRIPLSRFEYRGEGGIRTTLASPVFDSNSSFLLETGKNTGIFEVQIKIPRTIDGKTVHIGDWYEIRYTDISTPSNTNEEIKLKGRIG